MVSQRLEVSQKKGEKKREIEKMKKRGKKERKERDGQISHGGWFWFPDAWK